RRTLRTFRSIRRVERRQKAGKQNRTCMNTKSEGNSKPLYIANSNKLYVIQTTSPVPRTELVRATRPPSENWSSAVI
ncbi:hypothetical protein ALC56_02372, partial [Trachymyrmex septentrionalis]